jgi:hypothetical protein
MPRDTTFGSDFSELTSPLPAKRYSCRRWETSINTRQVHIPSMMNLRDLVDLSEIALTSFCAGVASKAFAFSTLSKAMMTNRLGASP